MVSKLSEIWFRLFMPDPDPGFLPISDSGSRIPDLGVKKAPDPDPQHWYVCIISSCCRVPEAVRRRPRIGSVGDANCGQSDPRPSRGIPQEGGLHTGPQPIWIDDAVVELLGTCCGYHLVRKASEYNSIYIGKIPGYSLTCSNSCHWTELSICLELIIPDIYSIL